MQEIASSLNRFGPEIALTVALLLVVIADSTGARFRDAACRFLSVAGLVVALVLAARPVAPGEIWSGMLVVDPLGSFFKLLLIGASLLVGLVFTFRNSRELR